MDTQLSEIRLTKEQAEEQLEIFRRIYSKVRLLSAEELKDCLLYTSDAADE